MFRWVLFTFRFTFAFFAPPRSPLPSRVHTTLTFPKVKIGVRRQHFFRFDRRCGFVLVPVELLLCLVVPLSGAAS